MGFQYSLTESDILGTTYGLYISGLLVVRAAVGLNRDRVQWARVELGLGH